MHASLERELDSSRLQPPLSLRRRRGLRPRRDGNDEVFISQAIEGFNYEVCAFAEFEIAREEKERPGFWKAERGPNRGSVHTGEPRVGDEGGDSVERTLGNTRFDKTRFGRP